MKIDEEWNDAWNERFSTELKSGAYHANQAMTNYCEQLILTAKKAYYDGEPIMSDSYFDLLEKRLTILSPNSKILEKVGSE